MSLRRKRHAGVIVAPQKSKANRLIRPRWTEEKVRRKRQDRRQKMSRIRRPLPRAPLRIIAIACWKRHPDPYCRCLVLSKVSFPLTRRKTLRTRRIVPLLFLIGKKEVKVRPFSFRITLKVLVISGK